MNEIQTPPALKRLLLVVIGSLLIAGCSSQSAHQPKDASTSRTVADRPEADLNEEQLEMLAEMTLNLKTGNTVADIDRWKDSLQGWAELFTSPAPPEMKPVFAALKDRVRERIAELEAEANLK